MWSSYGGRKGIRLSAERNDGGIDPKTRVRRSARNSTSLSGRLEEVRHEWLSIGRRRALIARCFLLAASAVRTWGGARGREGTPAVAQTSRRFEWRSFNVQNDLSRGSPVVVSLALLRFRTTYVSQVLQFGDTSARRDACRTCLPLVLLPCVCSRNSRNVLGTLKSLKTDCTFVLEATKERETRKRKFLSSSTNQDLSYRAILGQSLSRFAVPMSARR